VLVGQHLDLDMARLGDEFLDEHPVVAETRLAASFFDAWKPSRTSSSFQAMRMPLPPPPGAGLDHHRIADLAGDLHRLVGILDQAHIAGHRADARLGGDLLRGDLVAHRLDRARRRADEGDAGGFSSASANLAFSDRNP
jgi:hypothetical protein